MKMEKVLPLGILGSLCTHCHLWFLRRLLPSLSLVIPQQDAVGLLATLSILLNEGTYQNNPPRLAS